MPGTWVHSQAGSVFRWISLLVASWMGLCAVYVILRALKVWGIRGGVQVGPGLGRWAVVTGATDGSGKAYAEELGRHGMNIVLISRTQETLTEVTHEIEEKFKVQTKTIAVDFADSEDIYQKIKAGLEGLEIGTLVNNVGIFYSYPEYFLDILNLDNTLNNMININITSVIQMTRLVLPGMLERGKGVSQNLSSASALYPVPLMTVYSASKAFVDFFSHGLHAE